MNSCDDAAMIELLLANGADVHSRSRTGETALHFAAVRGYVECVKVLVAAGTAVNSANSDDMTSLHIAIIKQHACVVAVLLEHGAVDVINRAVTAKCSLGTHCCGSVRALMMCSTPATAKALLAVGADVHATTRMLILAYT
eukprot:8158-Heterococcus_DN1.PRE.2